MTDTYPPSEVIEDPTGENTPGSQGRAARGEVVSSAARAGAVPSQDAGSVLSRDAVLSPAESAGQYRRESEDLIHRQQADEDRYRRRTAPIYSELERADRAPRPAIPQLQNVGPPPDQAQYQKYAMGYMAAMSVLMAFSGRLTGRSATDSLNAFSGAAEGWRTGNQQAYENGYKQWEASNKRILQQNENQLKSYDLILKDRSLRREEILDRLKVEAVRHYDDQMYNATQKGNLELAYKLRDMQWEATFGEKGLKAAIAPYEIPRQQEIAQNKQGAMHFAPMIATNWIDPMTGQEYINPHTGQPYTDADKAKAKWLVDTFPPETQEGVGAGGGKGGGGLLSPATKQEINLIADGIESGREPPTLQGLYGKSVPVRAELERRKFDLASAMRDWQRAQVAVRSVGGPQMTRFVGLSNSVDATIDEALRLSKEMDLSGVRFLNRAEIEAEMNLRGNTPAGQLATTYISTLNTLKEEFANLAQGGYAPTEPVWKLANDQINADFGRDQLAASLKQIQRLIRYRVQAIPGLSTLGAGAPNRYVPGAPAPGAGAGGGDPLQLEGAR